MDAFNFVNQEPALPASDEEIIKLLGLNGNAGNNAGMLDDLVRDLDLGIFTETSIVVPTPAPMGYEIIQGHHNQQQQFVGHQPAEIISYVDLEPSETENSQYHLSGGYMVSIGASVPPTSPQEQEVSSPAPPPSSVVHQDTRKPAGGKTQGRRREPKVKLYQRKETLESPEEEKKRQNAINAKINRDKKKNEQQELGNLMKSLTAERDVLQTENTQLRNRCELIESQLKAVCKQFNVPIIILPQ